MRIEDNRFHGGEELALFALARQWKRYVRVHLESFLRGDVLEVGAGIGAMTETLHNGRTRSWVCLEPNSNHLRHLRESVAQAGNFTKPVVIVGTLGSLASKPTFDCLLYLDVLEHIHDDQWQISQSASLVRPGGHIVILAPAHPWLFSKFDERVGHLRRYDKNRLRSLKPRGWLEKKLIFLDSVGMLLCLGNALVLRRAMPSWAQIVIWDRLCVPISRALDRLLLEKLGKSVIVAWQKPQSD